MPENYLFHEVREEDHLRKKKGKVVPEVKPRTAQEPELAEEAQVPLDFSSSLVMLRRSIQEKVVTLPVAELTTPEDLVTVKMLHELITPPLAAEFKIISKAMARRGAITKEHSERKPVDINEGELEKQIEKWINAMVSSVRENSQNFNETDAQELEALSWMYFDSLANVINADSIEKDVFEFYKKNPVEALSEKEENKQKKVLLKDLEKRYGIDNAEADVLVDIITMDPDAPSEISLELLVETLAKVWKQYELGEQKWKLTKISLGYLAAKAADSFSPSLFENLMADGKFNFKVFLEFAGVDKLSAAIDTMTGIEMAKFENSVAQQINARIANSLFFQEFEFIHDQALGSAYSILEKGKEAVVDMLEAVIARIVPTISGIGMSLFYVSKIHPYLGATSAASMPFIIYLAKRANTKLTHIYGREKKASEGAAKGLAATHSGLEEMRVSAESTQLAKRMQTQLNLTDKYSLQRIISQAKLNFASMLPHDATEVISSLIAVSLQQEGKIKGGDVFSNLVYAGKMSRPMHDLVDLYFNRLARQIQDISRMDQILGAYDKYDLPDGEKEKERKPISEIDSATIDIKDLRYKNILKGINLKIEEGEFVVISGPSGSGKSTLLRSIVGLYKPEKGSVNIGDTPVGEIKKYGTESVYTAMAYANQRPQIFPEMTLRQNLLLWTREEVTDDQIKDVLRELQMDKFVGRLGEQVKHLSGGEQVRLGVARALLKKPKILLLDEPTSGLDSQSAEEVRRALQDLRAKNPKTTIVCVSHDDNLIKLGGRSVKMNELQN